MFRCLIVLEVDIVHMLFPAWFQIDNEIDVVVVREGRGAQIPPIYIFIYYIISANGDVNESGVCGNVAKVRLLQVADVEVIQHNQIF